MKIVVLFFKPFGAGFESQVAALRREGARWLKDMKAWALNTGTDAQDPFLAKIKGDNEFGRLVGEAEIEEARILDLAFLESEARRSCVS